MAEKEISNYPIRVKPSTAERLKKMGTSKDTMDSVITKLLDYYEKGD